MGFFSGILSAVLPAVGSYFGGPIGGMIGSAIGGGIQASSAERSVQDTNQMNYAMFKEGQEFNAAEAEKQRGFSERMANTSWQRGVADMQAAGLNPMLAYHEGGAATPSAASASAPAPQRMEAAGLAGINTAITARRLEGELEAMKAKAALDRSQALVNVAQVPFVEQQTRTSAAQAGVHEATAKNILERLRVIMPEEHAKLVSEVYQLNQNSRLTEEQWRTQLERTKLTKAEVELALLAIPRARNEAGAQSSWWMREISPYLPDFLKGASGAGAVRGMMR